MNYRTISTQAELDALPKGTIIRDGWGEPLTRTDDDPYYGWSYGEVAMAEVRLPAIVLWEPPL